MRSLVLGIFLASASGGLPTCGGPGSPGGAASASASATVATVPSFTRPGSSADPAASASPSGEAAASAAPSAEPAASASASGEPTIAVPDVAPPEPPKEPPPLPDVEVKTVGTHIGGGPNDNATKRPIREAIEPHFDGFRACFAKALSPKKVESFGVDVRIPGAGGRAEITAPRTATKGEGLAECMVAEFEKVEFKRPPKGQPMTVSYSIEFRAKGGKKSAKDAKKDAKEPSKISVEAHPENE